jgi:hypothetical protein
MDLRKLLNEATTVQMRSRREQTETKPSPSALGTV